MKYAAPFFLCLSMLSFEALSQIPGRGVPQPDPLILLMLSLAPFVIIFIMVVVLLYIARWIFKARHKEKMQLLENINNTYHP
jgi:heme/copper-type cytochrome/quinol oxidase subunit 2